MSAPAFTPGPWRYEPGENPSFHCVTSDVGDIAYLTLRDVAAESNARLMASAPDMLDALEEIAAAHVPDQPASSGLSERDWLIQHIKNLRSCALVIARKARGEA